MPRFYFDLLLGSHSNIDPEGHEIGSLLAAEIEALRSAGELARDQLFNWQSLTSEDVRVEVRDEHRQSVLTVKVSIRVDRAERLRGVHSDCGGRVSIDPDPVLCGPPAARLPSRAPPGGPD
jgi:hypothetical protein